MTNEDNTCSCSEFREVYHILNDDSNQEHFTSTLRHKLAHFEMVKS